MGRRGGGGTEFGEEGDYIYLSPHCHHHEHDKGLVYPTVACALSGVVVSEASRFVALCCRPCRTVIVDRDKLMVSYLLRIFS